MAGYLNIVSAPTAVAPDVMNFVDTEERRQEHLDQVRMQIQERRAASRDRELNLGLAKAQTLASNPNIDPIYHARANDAFNEAEVKILDAAEHPRSNQDLQAPISEATQELAGKIGTIQQNSKTLKQIREMQNPIGEMALIQQAALHSQDEEELGNSLVKVPNLLGQWNYDASTGALKVNPKPETDWTKYFPTLSQGITGTTPVVTKVGDDFIGQLVIDPNNPNDAQAIKSLNDRIKLAQNIQTPQGQSAWTTFIQQNMDNPDPTIWMGGKPPITKDKDGNYNPEPSANVQLAPTAKDAFNDFISNGIKEHTKTVPTKIADLDAEQRQKLGFSEALIKYREETEGTGVVEKHWKQVADDSKSEELKQEGIIAAKEKELLQEKRRPTSKYDPTPINDKEAQGAIQAQIDAAKSAQAEAKARRIEAEEQMGKKEGDVEPKEKTYKATGGGKTFILKASQVQAYKDAGYTIE